MSPPPFPWQGLVISLVLSLGLTLLIWGISSSVYRSTGYVIPWWLNIIIFVTLIFVIYWIYIWIQRNKMSKMEI